MEINSDKSKIIVNSIKPRPSANIWINEEKNAGSGSVQIGSAQTKDGTSIGSNDQTIAQSHSTITRLAILVKNNAICLAANFKLDKSRLSILLFGCES